MASPYGPGAFVQTVEHVTRVTTETLVGPNDDVETTVERYCSDFFGWCSSCGVDVGYDPGHFATVDGLLGDELACPPYDRDDLVAAVGCWVGEVCRQCTGAEWYESPDHGLCVRLGDHVADPFAWVESCLDDGGTLYACFESWCEETGIDWDPNWSGPGPNVRHD